MNFAEWRLWYKSLHWTRKWFVILILIRPFSDNFYDLKQISVVISPLYIIGILTPIFIISSFTNQNFDKLRPSAVDIPFKIWGVLVVINCFFMFGMDPSVTNMGDVIKYVMPIFIYFYCRRYIRDKKDLLGICQTFLYASIFPVFLILYESFVNPIAIEYMKGRGGGSRIRGGYGDLMNYALYSMGTLMIFCYYFISKNISVNKFRGLAINNIRNKWFYTVSIKPWFMFLLFAFSILVMNAIKHVATWGIFLMLLSLFMFFNMKTAKGLMIVAFFFFVIVPFFAQDIYKDMLAPLTDKEVAVVEGESELYGLGNGRMSRWEKYFEAWQQMPPINHFIGVSFSGFKEAPVMMSLGMHSDYVRNLFISGIIGVFSYVVFLLSMLVKALLMRDYADKFLALAAVIMVLMYSLTTMPSLYAPFLYILFSIYSYALLPKERQV